jgi:hypothetical protein
VDKALSIGSAILMAGLIVFAAWLFSGGFPFDRTERSLAHGLAAFGGPLGLWGGIGLVVVVGVAMYALHELCNYWIGLSFVRGFQKQRYSADAICARIDTIPISRGLKERLKAAARKGDGLKVE